jgi:hypothetical protein
MATATDLDEIARFIARSIIDFLIDHYRYFAILPSCRLEFLTTYTRSHHGL